MVEAIFSLCSGGIQEEPDAQVQIGIAPCFGGGGARFEGVGLQSDAAFYSTWTFLTKRMGTLFDSKGWPRRPMAGWSDACKAKDRLLAAGVEVHLDGGVRFTPAAEQLYTSTPWVQDLPVRENALQASPIIAASRVGCWMPGRVARRMIGRICKHLDAIQAAKLYCQTRGTDTKDHAYKKQVLLSSGGALAGPIWTEIPVQGQYFLTSHFIMATRRRLGVVQIQQGMTCQLTEGANTANARPCGEILDRRLTHPCANCGKEQGTRISQVYPERSATQCTSPAGH